MVDYARQSMLTLAAQTASEIEVTESVIVGLMLVAALVGIGVNRLQLPYTVALVVVGLMLGIAGAFSEVSLTSDLILLVFLPPLLFEGALNMDLDDLVRRWKQIGLLASVGTVISAAFITVALMLIPGMAVEFAILLGVILAPTDPVSVLAIFKEHGVGSGLRTLMEGESIFNDALAIVLYLITVEVAFGEEPVTVRDAVVEFGTEIVVGIAAGALVGFVAHRLMSTLDDHLVEITLSLVTAYGAFLLADRLNGSGVIAVVAGGLLIGNFGTRFSTTAASRVALLDFWEVLTFLANSALFLLMGLEFDIEDLQGRTLAATASVIVGMLLGRAVIAFGLLRPFRHARTVPIPAPWQMAVFWGGLRGSIPIALVLGLPERSFAGIDAVSVVFGVVMFSLLVQGVTYKPVLDRLGLTSNSDEINRYEELLAETLAMRSARRELDSMRSTGEIAPVLFEELREEIETRLEEADENLAALTRDASSVRRRQARVATRRLAAAQKRALSDATRSGRIGDAVARQMAKDIDVSHEEAKLEEDED